MKILIDTNFLVLGIKEKVDLIDMINNELIGKNEFLILKEGLDELKKLENKGLRPAGLAVENILKQEIEILDIIGPKDVDDKILSTALSLKAMIATLDKGLIAKAKSKGLKIIGYNKSKKRAMVN